MSDKTFCCPECNGSGLARYITSTNVCHVCFGKKTIEVIPLSQKDNQTEQQAAYERVKEALYNARVLLKHDDEEGNAEVIEEVTTAIDDLETLAPRDGWVLVPVEPTKVMQDAAALIASRHNNSRSWIEDVYKAMIASAPQPTKGE